MARSVALLLSVFLFFVVIPEFARAELWDHRRHYPRSKNLAAQRTSKRLPRRLSARQAKNTVQPGQPQRTIPDGLLGGYEIVGDSGVSAQQMFWGADTLVYILDKTENNTLRINNHAVWGSVYDITQNTATPLEVVTNTFCAGGSQLGDGQWLNLGGDLAVDPGGGTSNSQDGKNQYKDSDGGYAARTIIPGPNAQWNDNHTLDLTTRRWYPTLEPMVDGRIFVLGGAWWGCFLNDANNSNPTYEFWPPRDGESPIWSPILENSLPANLYPITHLLPSGQFLINVNRAAAVLDLIVGEYDLPEVPHAPRTYPASASSAMLPLTVENGWNATVMYCGGSDIRNDQWLGNEPLIAIPASASCIRMSPATNDNFEDDDPLPEARVLGSAILLPDATVLVINGANTGVAGYGDDPWAVSGSYADRPTLTPVIYDPTRPAGSRWSSAGLSNSTIPRLYHSSATLLPDGSVLVSGSNPHADYSPQGKYPTEYRVERFYPLYYNKRRPEPSGIPTTLSYGGQYFNLQLSSDDLLNNPGNLTAVNIWLMRTGFSTHAINFGMRMVELDHTFTYNQDGSATLHVSQAPPNPAIIPPGPAWLFVTINGVPSVGVHVTVGSGKIGNQTMLAVEALPESSGID